MEETSVAERARGYHAAGDRNCAQCVLAALSDRTGLDEETARRIAAGFGGGARSGELCGAIAGAVMALGLAAGDDPRCGKPGSSVTAMTQQLVRDFRETYGAVRCAELIRAAGGSRRCDEFIAFCAAKAAALIDQE